MYQQDFGRYEDLSVFIDNLKEPFIGNEDDEEKESPTATAKGTSNRRIIYCVFLGLISLVLLAGFAVLQVDDTRTPKFGITSMSMSSMVICPTESLIIADWNVTFSVKNPKIFTGITFDMVQAWLYRGEYCFLSKTKVEAFRQGPNEERALQVNFEAKPTYVYDWEAFDIEQEMTRDGKMVLDALLVARVTLNPKSWLQREAILLVDCRNVELEFSSPGSTTARLADDGDNSCSLKVLHRRAMNPLFGS